MLRNVSRNERARAEPDEPGLVTAPAGDTPGVTSAVLGSFATIGGKATLVTGASIDPMLEGLGRRGFERLAGSGALTLFIGYLVVFGDCFAHFGVSLNVFELVVVADAKVAVA